MSVDAGADVSDLTATIYFAGGDIRSSNSLADLTVTDTIAGRDIYIIELGSPASFSGLALSNGLALSDSDTVFSFVSFDDTPDTVTALAGPAVGMTSTDIGMAGAGTSLVSVDGGATFTVNTDPTPGVIPCLTAGTNILTAKGAVPIETVSNGDRIQTIDGIFKPLFKSIRRKVSARDMQRNPKLYPIRISADTLGYGLPERDLLVSRQHRMFVSSLIVKRMFGTSEVLIPAIKLTDLPGIYIDTSVHSVEYFHLLFEGHEVIYAEGAPTESLLLGVEAIKGLSDDVLDELHAIFPDLMTSEKNQKSKYLIPDRKRQSRLIARHAMNRHDLLSSFVA